jgi:hypothetical protein
MKQEWPLGKALEAGAEPLLPLPFPEVVAAVKSSGAIDAFARRRAGQIIHSGHTPESDLTKGIGQLASEAQWRLSALHEIVGRYRMNLPPERRARLPQIYRRRGRGADCAVGPLPGRGSRRMSERNTVIVDNGPHRAIVGEHPDQVYLSVGALQGGSAMFLNPVHALAIAAALIAAPGACSNANSGSGWEVRKRNLGGGRKKWNS